MKLEVLYCCDNNYAPWCGVSMLSLLERNRSAEEICVYIVENGVSEDNLARLREIVAAFGDTRELVIVNGESMAQKLDALGISRYRSGQTANLRLLFLSFIKPDTEKLLYLDCDTIVTDDLTSLFETDMGDKIAAVVLDALAYDYKMKIGLAEEDNYFNSGVILFDCRNWARDDCEKKIFAMFSEKKYSGANPDQDYLNFLLRGKTIILSPRYNFQTPHYVYNEKVFFGVCHRRYYYAPEQLAEAGRSPAILHAYRFLGLFPWSRGRHPVKPLFEEYRARTPFADLAQPKSKSGFTFYAERVLYRVLPKRVFFKLFYRMQNRHFNNRLKEIQGKENHA